MYPFKWNMTWNKFWTRWKDLDAFTYHEWARKVTETQINEWKASLYSILNIISHMNERTLSIWSAKQTNCKKREEKKPKIMFTETHTPDMFLRLIYMLSIWKYCECGDTIPQYSSCLKYQRLNETHLRCEMHWKMHHTRLSEKCASLLFAHTLFAKNICIIYVFLSWHHNNNTRNERRGFYLFCTPSTVFS